jgi:hypothetical protein
MYRIAWIIVIFALGASFTRAQEYPSETRTETLPTAVKEEAKEDSQAIAEKKKKEEELKKKVAGAFKPLFFDNDYSYLKDPDYKDSLIGDSLKAKKACVGTLDIGGEQRVRYHNEKNHRQLGPLQGLTGVDDNFYLSRTRLFTNWKVNDDIRFYSEFLHADSGGQDFAPRLIEVDRHDFLNLFADVRLLGDKDCSLTTRIGRQELLYGNERLVSPLDWGNTRRKFDGVKLFGKQKDWKIDGFWVQPTELDANREFFDDFDRPDDQVQLYGLYLGNAKTGVGTAEIYYLALDDERRFFRYDTIGMRTFNDTTPIMFELEAGYQFGRNVDDSTHSAGAVTGGLGKKFKFGKFTPTVWGWYDWASGDDNSSIGGWHHYFPLAHKYNGFLDLFGRRNLHDVNCQFIHPCGKKSSLLLWYHYFFLDQATTPYDVVMNPFSATPAASKDLGHEIDLLYTINHTPRAQTVLGYSFFDSGDYYALTPGIPFRGDASFFYAQYQFRF